MKNRKFNLWSRIRQGVDRKLTASIWVQLGLFFSIFILALIFLSILYSITGVGGLRQAMADIFGPDQFINYAYPEEGAASTTPVIVLIVTVVACVIGAVIFHGLLIATITNIIQTRADKVKEGDVEYKFMNHYLILGYNEKIAALIKSFGSQKDADEKALPDIVIAVEKDVQVLRDEFEVQLDKLWREHITLLHANRTSKEDLQRLCVDQAARIYIIGEEDENNHDIRNMECYGLVSEYKIDSYVYLREQDFFNLVAQYGPEDIAHFHMFNYEELWSRKVLVDLNNEYGKEAKLDYRSEEDNIVRCPQKQVHLVVMGMSEMGEALAREMAFVAHYPNFITHNIRTKITCVDPNMERKMKSFVGRYQTFFQHCHYTCRWWDKIGEEKLCQNTIDEKNDFLDIEFEFIEADVMDYHVLKLLKEWSNDSSNQYLNIALCQDDTEANFRNSHRLPTEVYKYKTPVWVYAEYDSNTKMLDHKRFDTIQYFGGSNILVEEDAMELKWAKCVNSVYNEFWPEGKKEWEERSISERWSNINNALSLPFKLRSIGAEYVGGKIVNANLTDKIVCLLGEVEHNRWNTEKLLYGYRPNSIGETHDKANFIHADICPNAELSDETKEKDRKLLCVLIETINTQL